MSSLDKLQAQIAAVSDEHRKYEIQLKINKARKEINDIHRNTTASRDIHTALNEYAPEQTVVVNEKNYISAGIALFGAYNDETQTRAIYHCTHCGHTDYSPNLSENACCPLCNNPYHSIINKYHGRYTLAYEPVGFRTDQNKDGSREEKTEKRYYDIRPVLLKTDWNKHIDINMCELIHSDNSSRILFYNVGSGHGFAFCKRCGRAAVEHTNTSTPDTMPNAVKPGHNRLWGDVCDANINDIARNVVFTGYHPTCYTVLRFKKNVGSKEYVTDEQLVYSLGVILKRALAKSEGIDETEIDFGIKQEIDAWVLYIYDTAKGGCGYSLKLKDPVYCQEIFDIARNMIEETTCNCHVDGGACTRCLIDRNNYRYSHLLSKSKVLDWLNKQKGCAVELPKSIKALSPQAKIVYQSLKDILKQSIDNPEVHKITLCVSDTSDDCSITDWTSIRSEMGKYLKNAVTNGKIVTIAVEYHADLHQSVSENLPFINLKDRFPDCEVKFIQDMGDLKTAIIEENSNGINRYFTDNQTILSFSNNWGEECNYLYKDKINPALNDQNPPTYVESQSVIVREGITHATMFQVSKYFSEAIAPSVLKQQDLEILTKILKGQHVDIYFSDMYVNSALSSLMLVYLIKEMRSLFGFTIDTITLQLDSPKRKCNNERFDDWNKISYNFPCKEDADEYTDEVFANVLGIDPEHSFDDANHHRWLRFEISNGNSVEIRFDHGVSGGYKSDSVYMNKDSLTGSVCAIKNNEDVLYYIIINNSSLKN